MRYLVICAYGHSRSVAMCRVLHDRRYQAVAVGFLTAPGAIPVLAEWAHYILMMDRQAWNFIPLSFRSKVLEINIGPDKWSDPYNPELTKICKDIVTAHPGIFS